MIKIEGILQKIGLTGQESRVYLVLLELQEAKTGSLCAFTRIASSNIYMVLDSLRDKGLVSYRMHNNVKVFMPSSPDVLNDLFLERQKSLDQERTELLRLISTLKKKPMGEAPQSRYKYYEGLAGIKSMWHEIDERMNSEHVVNIYTGKKGTYETMLNFFEKHHAERRKRQIYERLIYPLEEKEELALKRRDKFTQTRSMDLQNEAEWGVWNDLFYIHYYPVAKKPRAFLIQDKVFAKTFEQVFNQLWEQARP